MIHVGDITKLNGAELPVVDVITGGSPCQDLSVAGKRAGLAGERSGLFMEQVRIVKEMREHDRSTGRTGYLTRPRYMLWENVKGAFGNKGEDFRIVLEEIAKVEQEDAHIPRPEGGWPYAGCIMADGWSIAWRLHDAQFWGVPQRRKRIALVADFGGRSAPEILFERKGMRRDPEEGKPERKTYPRVIAEGAGTADREVGINHYQAVFENHSQDSRYRSMGDINETVSAKYGTGGNNQPLVVFSKRKRAKSADDFETWKEGDVSNTLNTFDMGDVRATDIVVESPVTMMERAQSMVTQSNKSATLTGTDYKGVQVVAYGLNPEEYKGSRDLVCGESRYIVRRLTPLECERLQGFPDGWTDIGEWTDSKGKMRKCSDSARYKALGNSIAIPFWFYILRRMAAQYERPATLGSLFDGIGGFPLCWERCNGKGTAIWASEIEEFPIAVTKKRFGDS